MAVSAGYLTKVRRAVRRNTGVDVDAELTDIIEECRLDLRKLGVLQTKAEDETDSLILGAVRCFARWKFGLSNEDAAANREDYAAMRDEMRKMRDYVYLSITFSLTAGGVAVDDAEITFHGETKETGAAGTAVFYYVSAGVNQEYTVTKSGYVTIEDEVDVTASTTINVALTAG